MNQETLKQSVLKIVLVSGVACIAWMYVVRPAFQSVQDQKQTADSHQRLIASYQERAGSFDSTESLKVHNELEGILEKMAGSSGNEDSGTRLHNLINSSASQNGVSVSRIESVNTNRLKEKIGESKAEVLGSNTIVRVEVEGDYGSVMSFMHAVVNGESQVKFISFRFIPIGHDTVRVNAEISSVVLTSIPTSIVDGGSTNE